MHSKPKNTSGMPWAPPSHLSLLSYASTVWPEDSYPDTSLCIFVRFLIFKTMLLVRIISKALMVLDPQRVQLESCLTFPDLLAGLGIRQQEVVCHELLSSQRPVV